MSKFGKFKDIFAVASAVAKPFVPGKIGSVLDEVNGTLSKGGASSVSADVAKQLAADNDDQTKAILALHARNEDQDRRIKELEAAVANLIRGR